ncbi:MAG: drug/metabolite transporter (DMT)-like permease [Candidatus Endobugula sp.]
MKKETLALSYGLTAVLLWSTVASAFKIGLSLTSVILLVTGACFFSLVVLAGVLLFRKELSSAIYSLWQNRYVSIKLGMLNPVLYYLILFEAYDRLPAQIAQPINYTWAIVLGLLAVPFLGRKITRWDILGMFVAYGGVFLISMAGKGLPGGVDSIGVLLALVSTVVWAAYWLFNIKDKRSPVLALFQNFFYALPVLMVIAYLSDTSLSSIHPSFNILASMAYIGLFEMGFTFILWQSALQTTEYTSRISSLIFLSPFVSLFIINQVLGEPLQSLTFVGLGVIVIGLALQRVGKTAVVVKDASADSVGITAEKNNA